MQVVEDDPKYWEVMSSALAIGWLDIVVSALVIWSGFVSDTDQSMYMYFFLEF